MQVAEEAADPDTALIRRAQAGDADAFGQLVERYMRRAYFGALSLVGSREDARDLSQEAFARAYRARRSIDPDRPFYAWLYQILRRLCFNFLRDRRARVRRLEAAGEWLAEEAADRASFDPARALEQKEARRRVAAAIEQLPAREREVLALKEFEGLAYREIAELVGIPVGTVMSRLYSARQRLAQVLEGPRS
ncbi:MAG TPA: sigma-70 family RNA polymerase sigma factor [Vicinamibacterales bacterium]|nr:sigma-70 family RNA polymerase sigma factor [Vicinamibacterales bacterium]